MSEEGEMFAAEAARQIARDDNLCAAVALYGEKEVAKRFEPIIQSAISKATEQAWQEHDDVLSALETANETIKQLGARNQQLREGKQ